ncbi:hypothetical protein EK21DRAFT_108742 [Setomelanomma holmii]|uniref:Uncharacterized protein n=1 Tax=Setomelanomma holmii TaxID=210430 RepID=A0A9P4HI15_9PLEO|nr:hypothetical protein EK21DRAFT_108742 [Setomelanomma holmii]
MVRIKASGKAPASQWLAELDERTGSGMTPIVIATLPSEPDRCFFIDVACRRSSSSAPEITFMLAERRNALTTVDIKWEPSPKAKNGTSFLDLPKEVRDMIYQEISGDLKREGLRWEQTAPVQRQEDGEIARSSTDKASAIVEGHSTSQNGRRIVKRPAIFADCAIMRTCRQIHAEFAPVLYASPFQLYTRYGKIHYIASIPISSLYVGLVRSVLIIQTCLNDAGLDESWSEQLQLATRLHKLVPNATCIRLGWYITTTSNDPWTLTSRNPQAWEATVRAAQGAIKRVKKNASAPLIVPHNFEVVQVKGIVNNGHSWPNQYCEVESRATPIAEAVRSLRAKQLLRRSQRTR